MSTAPKAQAITPTVARKLAVRARSTTEAVAVGNRSGLIEWTNASWSRVTGYAVDQIVDKPVVRLLDEVGIDPSVVEFIHLNFLAARRSVVELPIETPDGRSLWIHLEVDPVRDEFDDVSDFVAVATDITNVRMAEIAMDRHLEQEPVDVGNAIGVGMREGGGGATDSPQPSHAIRCGAAANALALDAVDMGHELISLANQPDASGEIAERLRETATRFLARAERSRAEHDSVDLSETVARCCQSLAGTLPQSIVIDAELPAQLPRAACDAKLLDDAVAELIRSAARHHFSCWGTISVTTGVTRPGHPLESTVYHTPYAATLDDDRERAYLEVHDDGHAIAPSDAARLGASPLPAPPPGRAFSLLRARALAIAAGGEFHIHSSVGCGTRVLVLLPTLHAAR